MFKRRLIISALMLALSGPALAGGSTGGATEVTQIMNNGELMASVAKQSQLVAGQIRDYANQVNQYTTMLQNLKNIPAKVISETMAPYKDTLRDLGQLYQATTDVYSSTSEAYETLQRRKAEMEALKLTPSQYLRAEMVLVEAKGGIYKEQAERDIKAFENAQNKSEKLASMSKEINNVKGNVQGLQFLAQQNQAIIGELMELNSQLREKSLQEKQLGEQSMKDVAEQKKRDLEQMEAMRKQRDMTRQIIQGGKYNVEEKRKELFKNL